MAQHLQLHEITTGLKNKNLQEFKDVGKTGRWSVQPWDLDLALSSVPIDLNNNPGMGYMIDPHDIVPYLAADDRFMFNVLWNDPTFRSMYERRVRTLVDQLYVTGQITQWNDQAVTQSCQLLIKIMQSGLTIAASKLK